MRVVAISALLIVLAAPASAQAPAARYVGRQVEKIRLLVEDAPIVDPALVGLLEIREGQPFSPAGIRESIAHLYSLGRFQDVQVDAADAPGGGVLLSFNLIPVHAVQRVEFDGDVELSERLLRRTVTEKYGDSPPVGRAADAARTLEQLYAEHGYLRARVKPVPLIFHDPDRTLLTFDIQAGPLARIRKISIEGDPREARDTLLRRLDAVEGTPYRRPELQQQLSEYAQRLRRRGFYQTQATFRATESEDGAHVDLVLDIRQGLPVTIRYEGDPVPAERLAEMVPLDREGSVEEDLLEDSETRIESYLKQDGYWKADVIVTREESNGTLTIVFTVKRGARYRVGPLPDLTGMQALTRAELAALVALKPGELFLESQLDAGVQAIRDDYRKRGFASVDVKSAVTELDPPRPGEGLIAATIAIVDGPRTAIREVDVSGNTSVPASELRPLIGIEPGDPYYEPRILAARDALEIEYLNRGFASVTVTPRPRLSEERAGADLVFEIQEGQQTIVDHILIVGNVRTDADVIRRELRLREGEPFGLQDRLESQRRLSALGLFRRVRITELAHGGSGRRDVVITVEEAPATSIGYGGGVEANQRLRATGPDGDAQEQYEFAPRGFFDIGRRNLGGKNRSVSLYTRVSLRRDNSDDSDDAGIGFSEYRVVGTYRQPRWFGPNDLMVTGVIEQGIRSSFNFARKGFNVDVVRRLTAALRVSARYSLSTTRRFDEQLSEEDQATIDRLFPQVRLSGFSGAVAHDTRDDLLAPTRGGFLSAEGSVAARALGGEVGFMKTYLQGFWFRRLPGPRAIVFASRAAIGLADGFPREVQPTDAEGTPLPGPPIVVEDLPASERFFAGGDTTIRGYALDTVGAPDTISENGFPTGGNAVLLLNGEVRVPVWGRVGAVAFIDGGNVFRRVTDFDMGSLRGAVGFGVRVRSPIGPIRVDLGFKLDRRLIGGSLEPRTALHLSFGQAF